MNNPVNPPKKLSRFDIRILVLALILATVGLLIFGIVAVYVNLKSKELHTQWLLHTPVGQVVSVLPAGGSGWSSLNTLIQTDRGYFSVSGGVAILKADTLSLVELGEGRIVWTGLSLRAKVTTTEGDGQWKWCMPDVFSIRNSSMEKYLEPVVHEIKVNRADLLGDLKRPEKRQAYLDVGGQCWYVLGLDGKGRPIGKESEIPEECGVMVNTETGLEVVRMAPKRPSPRLPFSVWMALAKSVPMAREDERNGRSFFTNT